MYKNKLNKIWNLIEKIKTDMNMIFISEFLEWFYMKLELNFCRIDPLIEISKWEIFFINLWKNIWWELNKIRPCIIISNKEYNWWNTVLIIPLKSYKWKLNNNFNTFINFSVSNWLKMNSISDLWSLKQVSKKRILTKIWILDIGDLNKIDKKLLKILWIRKRV